MEKSNKKASKLIMVLILIILSLFSTGKAWGAVIPCTWDIPLKYDDPNFYYLMPISSNIILTASNGDTVSRFIIPNVYDYNNNRYDTSTTPVKMHLNADKENSKVEVWATYNDSEVSNSRKTEFKYTKKSDIYQYDTDVAKNSNATNGDALIQKMNNYYTPDNTDWTTDTVTSEDIITWVNTKTGNGYNITTEFQTVTANYLLVHGFLYGHCPTHNLPLNECKICWSSSTNPGFFQRSHKANPYNYRSIYTLEPSNTDRYETHIDSNVGVYLNSDFEWIKDLRDNPTNGIVAIPPSNATQVLDSTIRVGGTDFKWKNGYQISERFNPNESTYGGLEYADILFYSYTLEGHKKAYYKLVGTERTNVHDNYWKSLDIDWGTPVITELPNLTIDGTDATTDTERMFTLTQGEYKNASIIKKLTATVHNETDNMDLASGEKLKIGNKYKISFKINIEKRDKLILETGEKLRYSIQIFDAATNSKKATYNFTPDYPTGSETTINFILDLTGTDSNLPQSALDSITGNIRFRVTVNSYAFVETGGMNGQKYTKESNYEDNIAELIFNLQHASDLPNIKVDTKAGTSVYTIKISGTGGTNEYPDEVEELNITITDLDTGAEVTSIKKGEKYKAKVKFTVENTDKIPSGENFRYSIDIFDSNNIPSGSLKQYTGQKNFSNEIESDEFSIDLTTSPLKDITGDLIIRVTANPVAFDETKSSFSGVTSYTEEHTYTDNVGQINLSLSEDIIDVALEGTGNGISRKLMLKSLSGNIDANGKLKKGETYTATFQAKFTGRDIKKSEGLAFIQKENEHTAKNGYLDEAGNFTSSRQAISQELGSWKLIGPSGLPIKFTVPSYSTNEFKINLELTPRTGETITSNNYGYYTFEVATDVPTTGSTDTIDVTFLDADGVNEITTNAIEMTDELMQKILSGGDIKIDAEGRKALIPGNDYNLKVNVKAKGRNVNSNIGFEIEAAGILAGRDQSANSTLSANTADTSRSISGATVHGFIDNDGYINGNRTVVNKDTAITVYIPFTCPDVTNNNQDAYYLHVFLPHQIFDQPQKTKAEIFGTEPSFSEPEGMPSYPRTAQTDYNEAVAAYNEAVAAYNNALTTYSNVEAAYNNKGEKYSTLVSKKDEYKTALTTYETDLENYYNNTYNPKLIEYYGKLITYNQKVYDYFNKTDNELDELYPYEAATDATTEPKATYYFNTEFGFREVTINSTQTSAKRSELKTKYQSALTIETNKENELRRKYEENQTNISWNRTKVSNNYVMFRFNHIYKTIDIKTVGSGSNGLSVTASGLPTSGPLQLGKTYTNAETKVAFNGRDITGNSFPRSDGTTQTDGLYVIRKTGITFNSAYPALNTAGYFYYDTNNDNGYVDKNGILYGGVAKEISLNTVALAPYTEITLPKFNIKIPTARELFKKDETGSPKYMVYLDANTQKKVDYVEEADYDNNIGTKVFDIAIPDLRCEIVLPPSGSYYRGSLIKGTLKVYQTSYRYDDNYKVRVRLQANSGQVLIDEDIEVKGPPTGYSLSDTEIFTKYFSCQIPLDFGAESYIASGTFTLNASVNTEVNFEGYRIAESNFNNNTDEANVTVEQIIAGGVISSEYTPPTPSLNPETVKLPADEFIQQRIKTQFYNIGTEDYGKYLETGEIKYIANIGIIDDTYNKMNIHGTRELQDITGAKKKEQSAIYPNPGYDNDSVEDYYNITYDAGAQGYSWDEEGITKKYDRSGLSILTNGTDLYKDVKVYKHTTVDSTTKGHTNTENPKWTDSGTKENQDYRRHNLHLYLGKIESAWSRNDNFREYFKSYYNWSSPNETTAHTGCDNWECTGHIIGYYCNASEGTVYCAYGDLVEWIDEKGIPQTPVPAEMAYNAISKIYVCTDPMCDKTTGMHYCTWNNITDARPYDLGYSQDIPEVTECPNPTCNSTNFEAVKAYCQYSSSAKDNYNHQNCERSVCLGHAVTSSEWIYASRTGIENTNDGDYTQGIKIKVNATDNDYINPISFTIDTSTTKPSGYEKTEGYTTFAGDSYYRQFKEFNPLTAQFNNERTIENANGFDVWNTNGLTIETPVWSTYNYKEYNNATQGYKAIADPVEIGAGTKIKDSASNEVPVLYSNEQTLKINIKTSKYTEFVEFDLASDGAFPNNSETTYVYTNASGGKITASTPRSVHIKIGADNIYNVANYTNTGGMVTFADGSTQSTAYTGGTGYSTSQTKSGNITSNDILTGTWKTTKIVTDSSDCQVWEVELKIKTYMLCPIPKPNNDYQIISLKNLKGTTMNGTSENSTYIKSINLVQPKIYDFKVTAVKDIDWANTDISSMNSVPNLPVIKNNNNQYIAHGYYLKFNFLTRDWDTSYFSKHNITPYFKANVNNTFKDVKLFYDIPNEGRYNIPIANFNNGESSNIILTEDMQYFITNEVKQGMTLEEKPFDSLGNTVENKKTWEFSYYLPSNLKVYENNTTNFDGSGNLKPTAKPIETGYLFVGFDIDGIITESGTPIKVMPGDGTGIYEYTEYENRWAPTNTGKHAFVYDLSNSALDDLGLS